MKKLVLLASVFALILSSCTQDLPDMEENVLQDVIFTASTELKYDMFDCDNEKPDYALLTFTVDDDNDINTPEVPYPTGGGEINTPVFYVNDVMYTQAIKLPANKSYTLIDMRLYATGAGVGGADLLVNAVPYTGSHYGNLITAPVPVSINVSPFTKTEVPISILCYDDTQYEDFGFTWFRIEENIVRTKYFFGDFCTKFFEDYRNAPLYADHLDLVRVDMPAIFEMDLYQVAKGGVMYDPEVFVDTFNNADSVTSGKPKLIAYPDIEAPGDIFRLDVKIYVKTGSTFAYESFGSWFWKDNEDVMYTSLADLENGVNGFTSGTDGVYDFILGNCNVDGADFIFAPYMNLPESISMNVSHPGTISGGYFDVTVSGIADGVYDFNSGVFAAYCVDLANTLGNGNYSNVSVWSTLYPQNLPAGVVNGNWDILNWLVNNLDEYTYDLSNLQQALWILQDVSRTWDGSQWVLTINYTGNANQSGGISAITTTDVGYQMAEDAIANGVGYQPMPGGWAAVVLDPDSNGTNYQTIFIRVDP